MINDVEEGGGKTLSNFVGPSVVISVRISHEKKIRASTLLKCGRGLEMAIHDLC
jgi:hypothetical protein